MSHCMREIACVLAALVLAACTVATAAPLHAQPPGSPAGSRPEESAAAAPDSSRLFVVTHEMRAHQRWNDGLYFGERVYEIAVLVALLRLGIGIRLRRFASKVTVRLFLIAVIAFVLFALVLAGLSLPFVWLSTFWVPRHFGVSGQSMGLWAADRAKELAVGLAVGAPLAALALAAIRRLKNWWLWLWLASVPLAIAAQVVVPVAFDPLFNTFEPLRDQKLQQELLALASKAGIDGGRVYEVDRSRQTNALNAYVNGLGPTKRIVLWDTIIAVMDRDELEFVMAHEMGHFVLNHIWRMMAVGLALLFVALWACQRIVGLAVARWGPRWGFTSPGDPAALPLMALVLSVLLFVSTPIASAYSRGLERQADTFAIELTRLNAAGVRAFVTLAERAKLPPDPNPFAQFWRGTHPTVSERIAECRGYKPWERGSPNRAWRPRD